MEYEINGAPFLNSSDDNNEEECENEEGYEEEERYSADESHKVESTINCADIYFDDDPSGGTREFVITGIIQSNRFVVKSVQINKVDDSFPEE